MLVLTEPVEGVRYLDWMGLLHCLGKCPLLPGIGVERLHFPEGVYQEVPFAAASLVGRSLGKRLQSFVLCAEGVH